MTDDLGQALLRELIRALPAALDDEALEALAARLGPHLHTRDGDEPGLLNTTDAARRANVHVETIRRAIRAGELDVAARIGRSPRLTAEAIDDWLAESAQSLMPTRRHRSRRSARSADQREYSLTAAFKAAS
jgi:excisionase family DNA binding protein